MRYIWLTLLSISSSVAIGQNVVINSWDTHIAIKDITTLTITTTKSVTILNEKGYREAVFVEAEDKFSKLTTINMEVIDANGKRVKKLSKGNTRFWSLSDENEIDDTRIVTLDPEYQKYPFTVNIESEVKFTKGFLNLPQWTPRGDFNLSVKKAALIVSKPVDFQLNVDSENIGEPEKTINGNVEEWKWTVQDLESIAQEISYKQFYLEQPKVFLAPLQFNFDGNTGSFSSWQAFGNWYLKLNNQPYEFGEETKKFLDGITTTDKEKVVKELYEYMQKRSRYISIQLGIGGFQSMPVRYVDSKGFGDCKALSNYMKSMLDYKGISSNYILVNSGWDAAPLNQKIVSNQFNHVFLGVPLAKDTMLLECTSQMLPAGYFGTHTDDRAVLWLDENKSQLIKTPAYSHEDNVIKSTSTIQLDKYGNADYSLHRTSSGVFYEDLMYLKSVSKDRQDGYVFSHFSFKDFIVDKFSFEEIEDQPSFTSVFQVSVNNLARNASSRLLVPVYALPAIDTHFKFSKSKKFAEIRRAFTLDDVITIELPVGFHVDNIPQATELKSSFGFYTCKITDMGDGKIQVARKVAIYKGQYMYDDFSKFNEFISQIKKSDSSNIILQSGT